MFVYDVFTYSLPLRSHVGHRPTPPAPSFLPTWLDDKSYRPMVVDGRRMFGADVLEELDQERRRR